MIAPPIRMITGPRRAGKTSLCRDIAEAARQAGWDIAGLLSPAQIEQGVKTGILAEDLRMGESRRLASAERRSPEDVLLGNWYFDQQTLTWGNCVLADSSPCDLLIVDELGPLELRRRQGWLTALEVLHRGGYRVALVVIRPELQIAACNLFDVPAIIEVDRTQTIDAQARACWHEIQSNR
ncbi:MAG: hypothetical protein JXB07_01485 [Anaerolineae bacterium]|nr:hypothetical protein [Anaerolineae bacterium]